ncbi:TetR/AcrR family transcriptional regulator [Streptacidiphilus sp. P02-A3a]|uniref:TetR/AcrR family transcriptional regulator n=1 Tax=Streptacidiphilus sp. P02-A3a TaxID=2704468 RepID=UPI0015F8F93D|nr:TetR/AcrR family transcriptional regulator [Streptacidiphilus sp. P02-A3a]QMU70083.1 TetR/AcrR family transcriptional regulator [Streptacidiphilus sp. P02-A3a]QMU70464.1 TetR/AcrR family transcriptional regulator [Streptacidiphilus sp. P02-A3a]
MGRPADPARRGRTLARATDYVLAHGLAGLSLRPLAAALGTSPRMLLYDFGSKEELVAAVLAEARRRGAARLAEHRAAPGEGARERLRGIWAWISADERAPFVRLFFEVHAEGLVHPETYPGQGEAVTDWFQTLGAAFGSVSAGPGDTVTPTLVMAVLRGLLFDLTATGDRDRADRALERFAELLHHGAPPHAPEPGG